MYFGIFFSLVLRCRYSFKVIYCVAFGTDQEHSLYVEIERNITVDKWILSGMCQRVYQQHRY